MVLAFDGKFDEDEEMIERIAGGRLFCVTVGGDTLLLGLITLRDAFRFELLTFELLTNAEPML